MWPFYHGKKGRYKKPVTLREWRNDIPDGELYLVIIYNNQTVCSASGRNAHCSSSISSSWHEFLSGKLDEIISKTMGVEVLLEAKNFVAEQDIK